MERLKTNKGITLVALVITVAVLLILSAVIAVNLNTSKNKTAYNKLATDIDILEEKILIYYNKNAEIPKTNRSINLFEPATTYWEIDLSKLNGLTLNYGRDFGGEGELEFDVSDVYVINDKHEIVNLLGIEYKGVKYYKIDNENVLSFATN